MKFQLLIDNSCVASAVHDLANHDMAKMVSQHDPEGRRTIEVVMESDTSPDPLHVKFGSQEIVVGT